MRWRVFVILCVSNLISHRILRIVQKNDTDEKNRRKIPLESGRGRRSTKVCG